MKYWRNFSFQSLVKLCNIVSSRRHDLNFPVLLNEMRVLRVITRIVAKSFLEPDECIIYRDMTRNMMLIKMHNQVSYYITEAGLWLRYAVKNGNAEVLASLMKDVYIGQLTLSNNEYKYLRILQLLESHDMLYIDGPHEIAEGVNNIKNVNWLVRKYKHRSIDLRIYRWFRGIISPIHGEQDDKSAVQYYGLVGTKNILAKLSHFIASQEL